MTARNWHLSGDQINTLQDESIERLVRMCKQAHYVDVKVRINGEYQHFQADWIKHLALADALSRQRNECHDAAENEMGCFRAVQAERLLKEAISRQPSEEAVDAKRYRWLRECKGPVCAGVDSDDGIPTGVQWLDTTDLDAAVDVAMLAAAGKGEE